MFWEGFVQLGWNVRDLLFWLSFVFYARNFSIQYIFSKLCIETFAGFSVSDLTGHHFMCFKLFKNLSA